MAVTYYTEGALLPFEKMMILIPRSTPRINRPKILEYSKEDYGCNYCYYKKGSKQCSAGVCPFYGERIGGGYVSYAEAYMNIAERFKDEGFTRRIKGLIREKEQTEMFFCDEQHQKRYLNLETCGLLKNSSSAAFASALFLLTANENIWYRARFAVSDGETISRDFSIGNLTPDDCENYTLFKTAKQMYYGSREITISELCDEYTVSDKTLRLILNALLIRRYGLKAVKYKLR